MKEVKTRSYRVVLYDRTDVSRILGISKRTVQSYQKSGKLPFQVLGGMFYTSETELMRFISQKG